MPLVKSGIKDFLIELIEEILKDINIEILKVDAIKLDHIEVISKYLILKAKENHYLRPKSTRFRENLFSL